MVKYGRALALILCGALLLSGCGPIKTALRDWVLDEGAAGQQEDATPQPVETPKATATPAPAAEAERFDELMNDLFINRTNDSVSLHITLEDPGAYKLETPRLWEASPQAARDELAAVTELKERLKDIDAAKLDELQQELYTIAEDYLRRSEDAARYPLHGNLFQESRGLHSLLATMLAEYAFNDEQDVIDYLKLLEDVPRLLGDAEAYLEEQAEAGLLMSDGSLAKLESEAHRFAAARGSDNMMEAAFARKISGLGLSSAKLAQYNEQNAGLMSSDVYPAYLSLADAANGLKGRGVSGGVGKKPDGEAYYEALLRYLTGSNKSPARWQEDIRERLSWLDGEIAALAAQYTGIDEMVDNVVLADTSAESVLDYLQDRSRDEFPPIGRITYEVRGIPKEVESSMAPAFYISPPLDNPRHNVIYIRSSLEGVDFFTTLAHEGFAGHMYQTNYFNAAEQPMARHVLSYPAWSEGWALYAEYRSYAYLGELMNNETLAYYMSLRNERQLARAALADLGVHHDGWGVGELATHYGLAEGGTRAAELYQYICSAPGNYLKYYGGYLQFVQMREDAEQALGDAFDPVDFHAMLLDMGECSFDMAHEAVSAYVGGAPQAKAA